MQVLKKHKTNNLQKILKLRTIRDAKENYKQFKISKKSMSYSLSVKNINSNHKK